MTEIDKSSNQRFLESIPPEYRSGPIVEPGSPPRVIGTSDTVVATEPYVPVSVNIKDYLAQEEVLASRAKQEMEKLRNELGLDTDTTDAHEGLGVSLPNK